MILRDPADAGEAAAKELQDFVKAEIAPYKYPRAIEFVRDLPRTETGKVPALQAAPAGGKKGP